MFYILQIVTLPSNAQEFILAWRKLTSTQAKAEYLNSILSTDDGVAKVAGMFKNEIPFGLLGEFVSAISAHCKAFNAASLEIFLQCLTETGRFNLSLSFLSTKEKECVNVLFAYLAECGLSSVELKTEYAVF